MKKRIQRIATKKSRKDLFILCTVLLFIGPLCWSHGYGMEERHPVAASCSPEKGKSVITIKDERLSVVANEAPIQDLLQEMGRLTRTDIVLGPQVQGLVTTRFSGLTVEEAIKKIADNWGMVFTANRGGKGYHISHVVIPASEKPAESPAKTRSQVLPQNTNQRKQDNGGTAVEKQPPGYRATGSGSFEPSENKTKTDYVSGELLVQFRSGLSSEKIQAVLSAKGLGVKKYRPSGRYHVLSLPVGLSETEAAGWLEGQPSVVFAEPNYLLHTQLEPDDLRYTEQWALENIAAPAAWDLETGRPEVIIAVIDTGVDYTHPDLNGNIWQNPGETPNNGIDDDGNGYIDDTIGWDFVDATSDCIDSDCGDRDADPMDGQGHGTHVAGIAGAVTNNGIGTAGVAWQCSIMAVRAGYKKSTGGTLRSDAAADAIRYAADQGAQVLNLSWGGNYDITTVRQAIQYAIGKGAIICAAAGNESEEVAFYPAAYDDPAVLAVGWTTSYNTTASGSNFGDWVDISAPGSSIISTCLNDTYCTKSGTSMAAPHVAGLTALLFSRFPGISPLVVKDLILDSALVVEDLAGDNATSGIINMEDALEIDTAELDRFAEKLAGTLGATTCNDGGSCDGDLDGDGDVDGADLTVLLEH